MTRLEEDRRQGTRLVSQAEIKAAAEHIAEEFPEVQAVWLFGSYARGEQRPTSDVDFAVMTSPEVCRDRMHRADLIASAEAFLGVPVDIVALSSYLTPAIIFEALGQPRLLFARDPEQANAFASELRNIARDDWPRVERSWQRTRQWLIGLRDAKSN